KRGISLPAISQACSTVMPAGTSISIPSMVIFGMGSLLFGCRAGAIVADAALDLGTEMAEQALDRPCGRVAQGADSVAFDLLGDVEQQVDLADLGLAAHHALHHAIHPAGALAARRALAAALLHVAVRQPG